jgi:N-acetylneuraminate lyase
MRNLEKYHGVIPAFYACYDKEGNIGVEGVKALTRYFIEAGVQGVCWRFFWRVYLSR